MNDLLKVVKTAYSDTLWLIDITFLGAYTTYYAFKGLATAFLSPYLWVALGTLVFLLY